MPCGARGDVYHIESRSDISNSGNKYIEWATPIYRHKAGGFTVEQKNMLRDESVDFAIAVSDLCDGIHGCSVYTNQLIRCSASVGANLHEAKYAQSRADFINKLEIALKECFETESLRPFKRRNGTRTSLGNFNGYSSNKDSDEADGRGPFR